MFWKSWQKKSKAEEFLDASDSKRLIQPGLTGHLLLWTVIAFMLVFLLWAGFAEIDEETKGAGKVIPSSKVQVIQYYEGGIVKNILVKEGQQVKTGQVLMEIDNSQYGSSYREGAIKAAALQARVARLKAESTDTPFEPPSDITKQFPNLAENEQNLYESNIKEMNAKVETLTEEINSKKSELEIAHEKMKKLTRSLELVSEEYKMTESLYKDGAAAKVEVLRLERAVNDLSGELEETKSQIKQSGDTLRAAQSKLNEVKSTMHSDAIEQLAKARAELEQQNQENISLEDRSARTTIKSPVNGTVKVILVNTIGGSVKPGMDLMEIVPSEDSLMVEAKVRPKDVAFIHPGQKAMVKFTAYDFVIYGGLEGRVETISADTITDTEDRNNQSYYLIKVRTKQNHLEHDGKNLPIIPGMTAEVNILTGKKTVLDYIMKPLLKSKQDALHER